MGKTSNKPVEESAATIAELECKYCPKKFFFNKELFKHETSHLKNKRLSCTVCGVGIASKASMNVHMQTHSNTRPFRCNECSKQFKARSNLLRHERNHTGDKPFECAICHKSFALKKNMRDHILTHTKEKPFMCPSQLCGKRFARRSTLLRHVRTHTGLRPFRCAHCPWTFAIRCDLQRHLFRKHQADSPKTKGTKNKKSRPTKAAKEAEGSLSNLDDHHIKIEEVEVAIATVVGTSRDGDVYEVLDEWEDIKEILPVPVEVINEDLEGNVAVSTSSETSNDGNNNALFGEYVLRELSTLSPFQQKLLKNSIRKLITETKCEKPAFFQ